MTAPTLFIVAVFGLATIASGTAWWTARNGHVCDRNIGYAVPARVARDPELRQQANDLVRTYCCAACLLSLGPVVILFGRSIGGAELGWSTTTLMIVAGYGLLVAVVAMYPFEAIKRLGAPRAE